MQANIGTHAKKHRDIRKQDIGIDAKNIGTDALID